MAHGDLVHVLTRECAEPIDVDAELVDRRDDGEIVLLREREVLFSGAGRDVDDAGPLGRVDVVPADDPVVDVLLRIEFVKRTLIWPADQVSTRDLAGYRVLAAQRSPRGLLGNVVRLAVLLGADIGQLG